MPPDDQPTSGEDWREAKRARIEALFDESTLHKSVTHLSPDGRYELEIRVWNNNKGWSYSEGLARTPESTAPIATVRRNYPGFPFAWIQDHPNGHDYLVCGEDYQGQTVIELDTGARTDHLPDDAKKGWGFCWAQHHVAPTTETLVVEGCYWGGPYELVAFDFSDPLSLPLPELYRWPDDEVITCDGFDDQGVLSWVFEREERIADGIPISELSDAEIDAMLGPDERLPDGLFEDRFYACRWKAGDPFEATRIERTDKPRPKGSRS